MPLKNLAYVNFTIYKLGYWWIANLLNNSARNNALPRSIPAKSIVNISPPNRDFEEAKSVNHVFEQNKTEPKTDEEILNYVIENSFKSSHHQHGYNSDKNELIREKKTPSPRLEPEDLDILNSIVPEPSIVIVPEPSTKCGKFF